MHEYKITITGKYDILIISPEIIKNLLERIEISETIELVISADDIIPESYVVYLSNVINANLYVGQAGCSEQGCKAVFKIAADQIRGLMVDDRNCFDKIKICELEESTEFILNASEYFYMLVKSEQAAFIYVYRDVMGKEVRLELKYRRLTE